MNRTHFSFNKPEDESSDTLSTHLPGSSYNSFGTVSPPLTGSPAHDSDSVSDNSKKIRKKRNTYQKIDDTTRMKLLDAVQQGETLKAAAKRYGINYSSAKSILHTYRKEGRILKKSAQERIARKRTKTSSDLEMSPIYPYRQFQGFSESAENQVYGSVDFQQKIDLPIVNGLSDDGQARQQTTINGMTINSFGDFLKVDSQGRTKSENSNLTSSIMLKLDSQRFQAVSTNNVSNVPAHNSVPVLNPAPTASQNSRNIQSGNWQLNVNVRSENPQATMVRTLNFQDEPRFTYNFTTRAPESTRPQEPSYVDFSNNTQPRSRREVPVEYDQRFLNKRYDTVNDMAYSNQEQYRPVEERQQQQQLHQQQQQNYDVSYFLNSSSPPYGFQPRANEAEQMGNVQEFSSENFQGNREQPDQMYGRVKKGPYVNTFSVNFEQGAPGMPKTASLRSY